MKNIIKILFVICLVPILFSCASNSKVASNGSNLTTNNTLTVGQDLDGNVTNVSNTAEKTDGIIESNDSQKEVAGTDSKTNSILKIDTKKETNIKTKGTKTEVGNKDTTNPILKETTDSTSSSTEETREEYFTVVFYNSIHGGRLQTDSLKKGETPTYNGPTPSYSDDHYIYQFSGWTNSRGEDVNPFKPITGASLFYAKYNIIGEIEPEPDPNACNRTDELVYVNDAHDEDCVYHNDFNNTDYPYVSHFLNITMYMHTDNGYVQFDQKEESGTNCDNSKYIGKVGQYIHSDGSVCPNPGSHNIH